MRTHVLPDSEPSNFTEISEAQILIATSNSEEAILSTVPLTICVRASIFELLLQIFHDAQGVSNHHDSVCLSMIKRTLTHVDDHKIANTYHDFLCTTKTTAHT